MEEVWCSVWIHPSNIYVGKGRRGVGGDSNNVRTVGMARVRWMISCGVRDFVVMNTVRALSGAV